MNVIDLILPWVAFVHACIFFRVFGKSGFRVTPLPVLAGLALALMALIAVAVMPILQK